MTGPLAGVRVLDFSTTFSGPYCTLQLADLGADVVKVESPEGDITRGLGTSREPGLGSVYVASNRGKASVALDLKDPANGDFLEDLIGHADVLVHNMRPAAAERIAIDAAAAMKVNPRLVHATVTGFGTDGPYSGQPAYDDTIQALSGLAWLQGLHGEPTYVSTAIGDKVTGLTAAMAIAAALFARDRAGGGQVLEIPMFETMAAFNLMEQWGGRAFVPAEGDTGYARMRSAHRRPYRTRDGVISVVVYNQGHWRRFLDAIGRSELLDQDEFRTDVARAANIDALYALLSEEIASRTTSEWLQLLAEIDVPVAPVKSLDELFEDEHLEAVDFFQEVGHGPDRYLTTRPAVRFNGPSLAMDREPLPDRLGAGESRARRWLDPAARV